MVLQFDDSLTLADAKFKLDEEQEEKTFKTKPISQLADTPISFNGVQLANGTNGIIIRDQAEKIKRLTIPTTEKYFASARAMAQYIGVNCRPDVGAAVQLNAPGGQTVTKDEFSTLRKVILYLQSDPAFGLTYIPIYMSTARLVLFTDASFGNAPRY